MVWLGGPRRRLGRSQPIVLHDPPPGPRARSTARKRAEFREARKHDPHLSAQAMSRAQRRSAIGQALLGGVSGPMVVIMGIAVVIVAGLVVGLIVGIAMGHR
jgi:hypothetical protein